ncbi:MAG: hypothetical protein ACR2OC_00480 [Solirubrobacterales bacterium]
MDQIVQVVGALLILAAFAAAQFHYLFADNTGSRRALRRPGADRESVI